MHRTLKYLLAALVLGCALAASPAPVQACPMCKTALEDTEDQDPALEARPKAYMYSILFMLSMPATLFSAFGIAFYRLSKKQAAMNASMLSEMDLE